MEDQSERGASRGPSLIDELLGRTRLLLGGMIAAYAKRSIDDLLRWMLGLAVRYSLSAALFIMAAAFLLLGGAKGLIVSGLPPYLAYLAMGAASLLAGLATLKCCPPACGSK